MTDIERHSYGWGVEKNSASGPRGIISSPEVSGAGNLVLRAGRENIPGIIDNADGSQSLVPSWCQTEHIVLTPEEARDFVTRCAEVMGFEAQVVVTFGVVPPVIEATLEED